MRKKRLTMMDYVDKIALYHTRCYSLMQNGRATYLQICCKHNDPQAFLGIHHIKRFAGSKQS